MIPDLMDFNQTMFSLDQFGAPAFIVAREDDGRLVYEQINQAAARLTGRNPAEFARRTPREAFGEVVGAALEANYQACLEQQAAMEFERTVPLLRQDVCTRTTLTPIHDEVGGPARRLLGVTIDVTEQARLQQALRRSESRLAMAVEALNGAPWYYDLENGEFEFSPAFQRLLGPDSPYTLDMDGWLARVHPDDRDDTCFAAIAAGKIEQGSNRFRVITEDGEERWLSCRRRAVTDGSKVTGVAGIVVDVTAEKRREAALSVQASSDPLTGLANRRRLDEVLRSELERAASRGEALSVLMVDVDAFKQFNDIYGHLAGDDALKRVATCLRAAAETFRATAARFGGEEFAMILPGKARPETEGVARELLASVRALGQPHAGVRSGRLSISIGVAACPRVDRRSKVDLLALADAALYEAKSEGRDRYRVLVPQGSRTGDRAA